MVIVQPYIPKYRAAFFEGLITKLASMDIDCNVAASAPSGDQSARNDGVTPDWVTTIVQKRLTIAGKSISLGGARPVWKGADGVIVGHLGSSLDTYLAIADSKKSHRFKVGLWGHIKSYVSDGHPLDLALERWQLRTADHVFAYTPGGAQYALSTGVEAGKITTVMNAVDTESLTQAVTATTAAQARRFMDVHDLKPRRTVAFLGGLDESKRIDFLAEVLDILWLEEPSLKIVVGGTGAQASLLARAAARGQAIMLGYATPDLQALVGRVASAILMPGRVGLVAVDALVLGLPILTTDWPYHSAEAEYLVEGRSRLTSHNEPKSFALMIRNYLESLDGATVPRYPLSQQYPTIADMIDNFAGGVQKMLDTTKAKR
ncbi:hypothetical protein DBZ45_12545 [Arthrobacter globiformis]|uniref:D-inositol 3-phosphate glycosyltransferase n=1 Tax=Arthrobacter globiformis TaxID=1665 RepID=A0A328HEF3_ARTGO|nr:hypothetical protein DBZ45_12545 [Arthrobacter globiformis]